MSSSTQQAAENWLTPSEEEQALLILQGKCPHNQGWNFYCHGHNDAAFTCALCDTMDFY